MALLPLLLLVSLARLQLARAQADPCHSSSHHLVEDQYQRSLAYVMPPGQAHLCDRDITSGWFRFRSGAGGDLQPLSKCSLMTCGTIYPVCLQDATMPTVEEGEVTRTVCALDVGDVCGEEWPIRIKNCGGYRVYFLPQTHGCSSAYCVGNETKCPSGQCSANGFSPGCQDCSATTTSTATTIPTTTTSTTTSPTTSTSPSPSPTTPSSPTPTTPSSPVPTTTTPTTPSSPVPTNTTPTTPSSPVPTTTTPTTSNNPTPTTPTSPSPTTPTSPTSTTPTSTTPSSSTPTSPSPTIPTSPTPTSPFTTPNLSPTNPTSTSTRSGSQGGPVRGGGRTEGGVIDSGETTLLWIVIGCSVGGVVVVVAATVAVYMIVATFRRRRDDAKLTEPAFEQIKWP